MNELLNGLYDISFVNKTFVHRSTGTNYGEFIDWDKFKRDDDDPFRDTDATIHITICDDGNLLISRHPTISYASILKLSYDEIFK